VKPLLCRSVEETELRFLCLLARALKLLLFLVRSFRVMGMRRVSVPESINQSEIVSQSQRKVSGTLG
jgi:hypothetical protein